MPFETLPTGTDTVVVRVAREGWLYAVSRAPFPVQVALAIDGDLPLTDLSTGKDLGSHRVQIDLRPYELRSFHRATGLSRVVVEAVCVPPERSKAVLEAAQALRRAGGRGAAIAADLERELAATNLVRCKHILESAEAMTILNATPPPSK
jgi:hypothetical protein